MSDLIDRQAAVKALEETKQSDPFNRYEYQNIGIDWSIDAIKALPSAQPDFDAYCDRLWKNAYERGKRDAQSGWIPVTPETEPKENGEYLVTRESKGLHRYIDIVKKTNVTDKMADDIVAYMPLPEPWEGGQDD